MANQEISLKISADVVSLNTALNSAAKNLDAWSKNTMGGVTSLAQSFVTLGARIVVATAPLTALAASLTAITVKTANAGDELYKTSQKTGIGIEKLSGLKYAAELSDISLDQLTTGIGMLSKNMFDASNGTGEAKDAFKELNIKVTDAHGNLKLTDELLLELADKFSNMKDGADKTALVMRIFGKAGKDLIPFLNEGSEGIKKLHEEAKKAGVVFSEEAGKSAEDFNDNITRLKENALGFTYTIGNTLIPHINQLFDTITGRVLTANRELQKFERQFMEAMGLKVQPGTRVGELERVLPASELRVSKPEKKLTKEEEKEREKAKKEAFEKEKKHNELIANNWRTTTKRLKDEDEKYKDDRIKLRDEELQAMVEAEQKQLDINNKLKDETLNNQMSLMSEKERLDTEYLLKKAEMEKAGIYDMKALTEWYYSEIQVLGEKASTKPDSFLQKLQKGVDSFAKALTGSTSSTEGLGAMVGSIVDLIKAITSLPKILNDLLKGLFTNLKHFPRELVNLIKDVLVNLPNILLELIVTVITELIPVLVSEIPNMIIKMISGLFEAIKTLIFGGEIKSTIDGWSQDASNQSVTVQLDTSNAMSALKQAQEALLGAVNETDRKVAREALLSARSAAILAEKQSQERQQQAQAKTFKGLFGYLGELFENIFKNAWEALKGVFTWAWDGIKGVFTWAWDGIKGVFTWAWDGLRGIVVGLWDFLKEIPGKIWDGIKGIADLIGKAIADAWEGIKNALGLGGGGSIGGIISGVSNFVNNAFHGFGLWHSGGVIKKAHSGMYLKDDEVPIIAQFGEGILNKYKGMTAIGGEAGLNFANRYGSLPGGNTTQNITQHQNFYFEVVTDKDGNVMKLTRTQAKNLARTLDPVFKEMKRNRELSFV